MRYEHIVIPSEYDEETAGHYVGSDNIRRSIRVYPSTSVEQVSGNLLRVEDDHRLASSIEVYDVTLWSKHERLKVQRFKAGLTILFSPLCKLEPLL